jgi:hypothetical protein
LDELEPLVALVNTSVPGTDAFFNGAQGKNLWISLILSTSKGSLAVDRDLEDSGSLPAFFWVYYYQQALQFLPLLPKKS